MSIEGQTPNKREDADDPREEYEPPTLVWEELFEVIALTCGKIDPTTFSCEQAPRTS